MKKIYRKDLKSTNFIETFRATCTCSCQTCVDCTNQTMANYLYQQTPASGNNNFSYSHNNS